MALPPSVELNFTLGSKQSKPLVIRDLQQADSADFDSAFTSFRSRISRAIQSLSTQPTNAVDDSQEVPFTFSTSPFHNESELRLDYRVSVLQGRLRIEGRLVHEDRLSSLQPRISRQGTT